MKKLMSVMIGLGLMMGTVSLFAQAPAAPAADEKTEAKKPKTKKSKKKAAPAEEKKTA
ncbi:MAG TPA: hypothetical protein VN442_23755 [Bryobacteraceae bacterium]|nr:hypothetical protein [Bryobacteraceae bacterium]